MIDFKSLKWLIVTAWLHTMMDNESMVILYIRLVYSNTLGMQPQFKYGDIEIIKTLKTHKIQSEMSQKQIL